MTLSEKIRELTDFANENLAKHYLLEDGWTFGWNNRKRAFGLCNHSTREIQLSRFMLECGESVESMKGTIIHEIAHALAGAGAGHGAKWQRIMIQLGQNPSRTRSAKGAEIKYKWYRMCKSCGQKRGYHRKPKGKTASCGICSPVFNEKYLLEIVRA